jgi:E3 ubiquitin-protein ligase DOA10
VIQSLARTKFDAGVFTHDNNCPICMEEYLATDEVTQLKCDSRHYFHTACLEAWIEGGNNKCPLCRKPISEEL